MRLSIGISSKHSTMRPTESVLQKGTGRVLKRASTVLLLVDNSSRPLHQLAPVDGYPSTVHLRPLLEDILHVVCPELYRLLRNDASASTTCMTDNQIDALKIPSKRVAVIEPNNTNLAFIDKNREHFILSIISIIVPTN